MTGSVIDELRKMKYISKNNADEIDLKSKPNKVVYIII